MAEVNQKAGFDWSGVSSWWDDARGTVKEGTIVALREYAQREIGRINPPIQTQVQTAHIDNSQTQKQAQPLSTFDAMKAQAAGISAKAAGVPLGVWLAVGGGLALAVWARQR